MENLQKNSANDAAVCTERAASLCGAKVAHGLDDVMVSLKRKNRNSDDETTRMLWPDFFVVELRRCGGAQDTRPSFFALSDLQQLCCWPKFPDPAFSKEFGDIVYD